MAEPEYQRIDIAELQLCGQCGALVPAEMTQNHDDFHEAIRMISQILKVMTNDITRIKSLIRGAN